MNPPFQHNPLFLSLAFRWPPNATTFLSCLPHIFICFVLGLRLTYYKVPLALFSDRRWNIHVLKYLGCWGICASCRWAHKQKFPNVLYCDTVTISVHPGWLWGTPEMLPPASALWVPLFLCGRGLFLISVGPTGLLLLSLSPSTSQMCPQLSISLYDEIGQLGHRETILSCDVHCNPESRSYEWSTWVLGWCGADVGSLGIYSHVWGRGLGKGFLGLTGRDLGLINKDNNTVGTALVLYMVNAGLIPGRPKYPHEPARMIPKHRARCKSWAILGLAKEVLGMLRPCVLIDPET